MKKLYILAAVGALGLLGGCAGLSGAIAPPATVAAPYAASGGPGAATALDEKAMFAAEASYNIPAHAFTAANEHGLLSADLKAKVKPLLVAAYSWLEIARTAYAVGNSASFLKAVANVRTFATQAGSLIPHLPKGTVA